MKLTKAIILGAYNSKASLRVGPWAPSPSSMHSQALLGSPKLNLHILSFYMYIYSLIQPIFFLRENVLYSLYLKCLYLLYKYVCLYLLCLKLLCQVTQVLTKLKGEIAQ